MPFRPDDVVLTLGGEAVKIHQHYEVRAGVFDQPSSFAVRLGNSRSVAELIRAYPENTPFSLQINGNPAQSGFTDGFGAGEASGASMLTLRGRDIMARVTKAYVGADRGFAGLTYAEFVEQVLALAFGYVPPDTTKFNLEGFPYTRLNKGLSTSNEANRRRMTGVQKVQTKPPQVDKVDIVLEDGTEVTLFKNALPGTSRTTFKTAKVEFGTKWYEGFAKVILDRGGLFLWAAADGTFILSTPNPNQEPSAQITRFSHGERGLGRVVSANYDRGIQDRYSRWIVIGKGGGRKFGRAKTSGDFVDQEVARILGGADGAINTHHDDSCDTIDKCRHLARRRCAEANRGAFTLSYTVSGHSTNGPRGRAVWAQDTVVAVDDRILGINGNFYIETVTMNCQPHQTTTLKLMRLEDLFFGDLEAA